MVQISHQRFEEMSVGSLIWILGGWSPFVRSASGPASCDPESASAKASPSSFVSNCSGGNTGGDVGDGSSVSPCSVSRYGSGKVPAVDRLDVSSAGPPARGGVGANVLDAEGMRREMGRASESGGTWWRASGLVGSCSAEAEEGDGGGVGGTAVWTRLGSSVREVGRASRRERG